jgi:uncharacterized Tic20 family protein
MEEKSPESTEDAVFEPLSSAPAVPSRSECQWAVACHLSALGGIFVPVPAASILCPLVVWVLKRGDGAFIDDQGKESLNFQISLFIYLMVCVVLSFVGIGLLLLLPVVIFGFICVVVAAVKAGEGVAYRYPASIRFIK